MSTFDAEAEVITKLHYGIKIQNNGEAINVTAFHPTVKFSTTRLLGGADSTVMDFIYREPPTSLMQLSIRIRLGEDKALAQFGDELAKDWALCKDEKERFHLIANKVVSVLGGSHEKLSVLEKACIDSSVEVLLASGLNFVSLGSMIGKTGSCCYRALLFKFACDLTVKFERPFFNGKSVQCELRSGCFEKIHNGAISHVFNVIQLDGVQYILDLERSNIPIRMDVADYEKQFGNLSINPIPIVRSACAGVEEKTMRPISMRVIAALNTTEEKTTTPDKTPEEKTTTPDKTPEEKRAPISEEQFAKLRSLHFSDRLNDGFTCHLGHNEAIIFDAQKDESLRKCISHARNLLTLYPGTENRAGVLAKYVAMKMGGQMKDAVINNTNALLAELRTQTKNVIPIGRLLDKSMGLVRHRSLLYKYLADLTISEGDKWFSLRSKKNEPVICAVEMPVRSSADAPSCASVATFVMIGKESHFIELASAHPKVEAIPRAPLKTSLAEEKTVISAIRIHLIDTIRFMPNELTECKENGSYTLKSNVVTVRKSLPGQLYDLDRALTDIETLLSAAHANVPNIVGLYYNYAPSITVEEAKAGKISAPYADQLWICHGEAKGTLLSQMVIKSSLEQRLRICYQIAAALSHFHSLGLCYGELTTATVRIIENGKPTLNVQLTSFDLDRYAVYFDSLAEARAARMSAVQKLEVSAFWSPERFCDSGTKMNIKDDIYAFGCVMMAVLVGYDPWPGKNFSTIKTAIQAKQRPPTLKILQEQSDIAPDAIRIIEQCLSFNAKDRIHIDEILERIKGVIDYTCRVAKGLVAPERKNSALCDNNANFIAPVHSSAKFNMGASIGKSRAYGDGLTSLINPMNGPSIESCDAAREAAYGRYGVIDSKMLVGEQIATYPLYIIHRNNGNVALVSRGLSDPPHDSSLATTGLGLELWGEASESEVGTGAQLGTTFLFQMMYEVTSNAKQMGMRLRQLLDAHDFVSMELNNVDAPALYVDPNSGRVSVLLGIPAVDVADYFYMPGGLKVRIVTVRLLTFDECLITRRFTFHGRKSLVAAFARDGSRHISTVRHQISIATKTGETKTGETKTGETKTGEATPNEVKMPIPYGLGANSIVLPGGPLLQLPEAKDATWTTDQLNNKLSELKVPIRTISREARAETTNSKPSKEQTIKVPILTLLPPYDPLLYDSGTVSHAVQFAGFCKPGLLATAMCMLDMRLRVLSSPPSIVSPIVGIAKHIVNTLHTQTQIAGWVHFEEYVNDADLYITRMTRRAKAENAPPLTTIALSDDLRPVGLLQSVAEALIKRMLARVQWVAELCTLARQDFNPDLCINVIASDGEWMDESNKFMKEAETKVSLLLSKNSARFGVFRDLQKRGVAWPHNAQIRRDIEAAGFTFRPMMVKRDRCVCDICGVEISGWRAWLNPWHLHALPKHSPEFAERVARCGPAFAPSGLFALHSSMMDPAALAAAAIVAAANAATAITLAATVRPPVARPVVPDDTPAPTVKMS